ncbi:hypothetical protein [Anaerotignum sp.]|uniref:hypothetical protein n=1 Tax=Anaerotignum sp. TaxID=2039241 RepID=UPI0028A265CB|nr:hypothetical protein [Anaerotignum sp.]
MNLENNEKALKRLIAYAYRDANLAHKSAFSKGNSEKNQLLACVYANKVLTYISSADTIYLMEDEIVSIELEQVLHQFKVFVDELIKNVGTDHSHQWTDIEYIRLVKKLSNYGFEPFEADAKYLQDSE